MPPRPALSHVSPRRRSLARLPLGQYGKSRLLHQLSSPTSCRTAVASRLSRRIHQLHAPASQLLRPHSLRPITTTVRSPAPAASRGGLGGGAPFSPLVPPSPASLGAPRPPRTYRRVRRWGRRLLLLGAVGGAAWLLDREVWASGGARSLRTFGMGLLVALDYKLNFRPEGPLISLPAWLGGRKRGEDGDGVGGGYLHEVHARNAARLSELLRANGGLYLKIGQAIAMQSAVLPPEFRAMFARMFDDAPQDEWPAVERVIRDEFGGRSVEEVFGVSFKEGGEEGKGVMERRARASASVAQVHWARLADGREVAIKIQKPEIARQVAWDLWAFRVVARVYTYWFDLPLYSLVPFITERLMLETDFLNEAANSETMRKLVAAEPRLRDRVYIPTVYPELSTRRVLTAEWIEGVRLWDKEALTSRWLGGHGKGSPGARGRPLSPPDPSVLRQKLSGGGRRSVDEKLKPERNEWRGPRGKGGLGLSTREVMTLMVDLFSAQIFRFGVVHCDPHPGNIFIRRQPNGHAELVLIDHGLYVYLTPEFRRQYAVFWKALMTFDNKTIADVTSQWGIKAADLFASATLLRPYEGGDASTKTALASGLAREGASSQPMTSAERSYEMQRRMKQGIRDVLADEDKWPKELIFVGRNMRIVQGNNQFLGSPVNRVKLMGEWASASLYRDPSRPWYQRIEFAWRHVIFEMVMFVSDLVFYFFALRQWLGLGGGMEDEMEARMKDVAKEFGVELQHDVFEG